jgi:hypothetical protein
LKFDRTEDLGLKGVPNRFPILKTIIWCSFLCVVVAVTLIGLTRLDAAIRCDPRCVQ